jgi:hypothetical protein
MKDFLRLAYLEPLSKDAPGYILMFMLWISSLGLVGIMLYALVPFFDTVGLRESKDYGIIVEKNYTKAHTSTLLIIPRVKTSGSCRPEAWRVKIRIGKRHDWVEIKEDHFNRVEKGQTVMCLYKRGRITNAVYIRTFW